MAIDKIESASLASDAVNNTNIDSTLITAQTAKTSLVDADKFLISDSAASGALKYVEKQYLPSGKMVNLANVSTRTPVASVLIDGVFDQSKYSFYQLYGWFRPETSGTTLQAQFRTSAPASLTGNNYYSIASGKAINGSGEADKSANRWGGTYLKIASDVKNASYNAVQLDMTIRPLLSGGSSTINVASVVWNCGFWENNSGTEQQCYYSGAGYYTANNNMNGGGISFYQSSDDISEYEYALYGVTQT